MARSPRHPSSSTEQVKKRQLLVAIVLIILVLLGLAAYGLRAMNVLPQFLPQQPRACTLEAKLCPDGSSVGRTGPNCEFAPCPSSSEMATDPAMLLDTH